MKFSVLSHASLEVQASGRTLLTDPWLRGSCYWRSWWNFPEAPMELIEGLKPDFIYLTHLHWDHFHADSLKYFSSETPILIPLTSASRFRGDLESLGFKNILELSHGKTYILGPQFKVTSYQFGFCADSALVIEADDQVLLNANDCKLFGRSLAQIQRRHPRIDFVFRSHSNASGIPYCIEDYQTRFPQMRSQTQYMDEFIQFALYVGARYAIPFASNHCFLHRDTEAFNSTATSPAAIVPRYEKAAAERAIDSTCVLMPPGSHWSTERGFQVRPFDYATKADYVARLQAKYLPKLDAQYAKEAATRADFRAFKNYFQSYFRALPWIPLFSRASLVVFQTTDAAGTHHWGLDLRNKQVIENANPANAQILIETPALVLNDCTRIKMFSVWTASKRLKIQLASNDQLKALQRFFILLDFYELDCLPLRKNFSLLALRARLPRWREACDIVQVIWKKLIRRRSFALLDYFPLPPVVADYSPMTLKTGSESKT